MSTHIVGYASSVVLLVTITTQLVKQWRSGTSKGVSPYLFVGQLIASGGFVAYSALVDNFVFIVTNACLAVAALLGIAIVTYHKHKERTRQGGPEGARLAAASLND